MVRMEIQFLSLAYSFQRCESVKVLVTQLCLTLCNPMDCGPGSSVHGTLQARILEWVLCPSPVDLTQTRDQTQVSWITGRFLLSEPPGKPPSRDGSKNFNTCIWKFRAPGLCSQVDNCIIRHTLNDFTDNVFKRKTF